MEIAVNQDSLRNLQYNLAGVGRIVTLLAIVWFLGVIGLGWLVKSFLILIGLILITPVIAFVGLRWWIQRNLVQSACPVCQYEFTGFNQAELRCPNCNELLKVEAGEFRRFAPDGTIDVDAVEVSAQRLEES